MSCSAAVVNQYVLTSFAYGCPLILSPLSHSLSHCLSRAGAVPLPPPPRALVRRSVRGAPHLARPLETANEPLARGYRRKEGAVDAVGQPNLHLQPWRPSHDMAVVHGELLAVRQLAAVKPAMPGGPEAVEEATLGAASSSTRGGGMACSGEDPPRESKAYLAAQSRQARPAQQPSLGTATKSV